MHPFCIQHLYPLLVDTKSEFNGQNERLTCGCIIVGDNGEFIYIYIYIYIYMPMPVLHYHNHEKML
jgi:hypothetical protein